MKKGILAVVFLAVLITGVVYLFNMFSGTTGSVTSVGSDNVQGEMVPSKIIEIQTLPGKYDPSTVTVTKGDQVRIIIVNNGLPHGILIPELGVSGIESVDFLADKTGSFRFKCPTFCGEGYKTMVGTLIVTE